MSRSLHSTFCDDIRMEVGNKLSMMGIYQNSMVVPGFPFDLPRIYVSMKATAPKGDEFKSVKFVLMLNNDIIAESQLDDIVTEYSNEFPSMVPDVTDLRGVQTIHTIINLPALRLESPSVFRTRAVTERETLYGGGLMVVPSAQQ